MRPLPEALATIAAGWSGRYEITDRAAVMGAHALAGNVQRAEEYAVEIEALQRAQGERDRLQVERMSGFPPSPSQAPEWAEATWQIGHAAWANILVHGWRCSRTVWAGADWTAENVVGWLQVRHPRHAFTVADVIAPRVLVGRVAA